MFIDDTANSTKDDIKGVDRKVIDVYFLTAHTL